MALTLRNKYQITLWVTVEEELAIMHLFSSKGWHYINYNAYAVRQHINEGHLSSPIDMSDRNQGLGEIHSSEHYVTNPSMDYTPHPEYTTLKSASENLAVPLTSHEVSHGGVGGDYIPPVGVEIVYRDSGEYLTTDTNIRDVSGHDTNIDTNYTDRNEHGVEAQLHGTYEKVSVEPIRYGMNHITSVNEQGINNPNEGTSYHEGNRSDINAQLNVSYEKSSDETNYGANNVIIVDECAFKDSNGTSSYTVIGENMTNSQVNAGNGEIVHHESNVVGVDVNKSDSMVKDVTNPPIRNEGNHERSDTQVLDGHKVSSYGMYVDENADRNNSTPNKYQPDSKVSNYAGNMEVNDSSGLHTEHCLPAPMTELEKVASHKNKDENTPVGNVSSSEVEPVLELVNDADNTIASVEDVNEFKVSDGTVTEASSIATTRQQRKTAAKAQSVIKSVTNTRKRGKSQLQILKKTEDSLTKSHGPEEKTEIQKPKMKKKEVVKNKKSQSEVPILLEEDKKLTEMSLMLVNACDDDPFMCCLCNEQFSDVQQFKDHATEKCLKELLCQKDTPVFKCKDCGQHYWQAFTLVRHRLSQVCQPGKSKKVDGFLTCEHCGKTYPTRRQTDFTLHVMMHHDYKPHACDICGKKFMRWTSLRDHKRKHSGERPYKCNYCDLTFTTGSHQRNHELLKHIEVPRRFVCEKCGAAFKFSGGLSTHIKEVHTEEKKFVCNTCGRQFKRRGSLTEHFKTHSDVKDKICDVCGKAFYRRSHLNKHAQRHTNNRKHGCEDCGKRFFTKQSLEVHQRIHSGDKPFACKFCTYKSTSNGNLKKHVLAVHADVRVM